MGVQRLGAGITVALTATIALVGCAATKPSDSPAASSPESSPQATASGSVAPPSTQPPRTEKWIELKPGDCLAEPPSADPAVVTVAVVDCSQPHLAETFLRAPIPVDAALEGTANAQCEAGLLQYTGRASAGSPYTISYLIDSDQDRTENNPLPSTVICLLQGAQGQTLTGSARG
ncbi:MAG: septum formation family protein [Mycobacterium sp.]|nr:septum formation family protein [Mycobacterium sp.]